MKLPEQVQGLIDGKNYAHFATILPTGAPHVAPVWIDRDDDTILVNTTINRRKTKNIAKDPRIAISIYSQANPYEWASIQGEVMEQTQTGAQDHIHRLAKKYLGQDRYLGPGLDDRIILKITASHIITPKPFR